MNLDLLKNYATHEELCARPDLRKPPFVTVLKYRSTHNAENTASLNAIIPGIIPPKASQEQIIKCISLLLALEASAPS